MSFEKVGKLPLALTVAVVTVAAQAGDVRTARADKGALEVDVFTGWHLVSKRSDLGKPASFKEVSDDGPVFGARVGYFIFERLTVEADGVIIPTNTRGDDEDTALLFGYRLQATWQITSVEEKGGSVSLLAGVGGLISTDSSKNGEPESLGSLDAGSLFMPHVGALAKVALGDNWGLRFDGRVFLAPASKLDDDPSIAPDWEVNLGAYMYFGGSSKPAPAPTPEPTPAVTDADGDGILDAQDKCPAEAEDKDGFQDDDGCADPDNDGDGVPDAQDKCPAEAEDKDGFQDDDGCADPDNDGDGVLDAQDKCPDAAEDKDGFQDDDACPDPDNDQDGVLDADDKCPDQLETKNGFQDKDGCADEVPKAVAKFTGVIAGINFDTGKATITKPSFKVLDAAIKVLNDFPDLKMEIGGHTDDVGEAEANKKLSQERAQAVKDYFVSKGIAEDRVRAVGYGPEKPLDPAKTAKARAKNRRVEFQLISE
jgi:outer membrane protein OmpA-like peptidoglycan-associated protein